MARLFDSSCGDVGSVVSGVEFTGIAGTVAISTTTVRTPGGRSLRLNPAAAAASVSHSVYAVSANRGVWTRVYVYVASLPSTAIQLLSILPLSGAQQGRILMTTTGALQLIQSGGTQVGSNSPPLNVGQWYRISLKMDSTTNPGTLDARIDGASFASGNDSTQSAWGRVRLGWSVAATADIFFDDWAINDDTGASQNGFPGEGQVYTTRPTGDGDSHQWLQNAIGGPGSATNWTLVDEAPPNDATDFVASTIANRSDLYAMGDLSLDATAPITCATIYARAANGTLADATTAFAALVEKTAAGTLAQGANRVPNSTAWVTGANGQPDLVRYTDPDGAAWTPTTINSMQAGVKLTVANVQLIQVTALWVNVDVGPTAVSGTDTGGGADANGNPAITDTDSVGTVSTTGIPRPGGSDTGGGAEGTASATVGGTDTAGGTDQEGTLRPGGTEATSGAEVAAVAVTGNQVGGGAESTGTVAVLAADGGAAGDLEAVSPGGADTSAGADAFNALTITDTDAAQPPLAGAGAGYGTGGYGTPTGDLTDYEHGTVTVLNLDTGAGADDVARVGAQDTDQGQGQEDAGVGFTGADSATGGEAGAVVLLAADLAGAAEQAGLTVTDAELITMADAVLRAVAILADQGGALEGATLTVFGAEQLHAAEAQTRRTFERLIAEFISRDGLAGFRSRDGKVTYTSRDGNAEFRRR